MPEEATTPLPLEVVKAPAKPVASKDVSDLFHRSELTVELRKPQTRSRSTSPIPVTVANVTVDPCVLAAAAASAEVRRRKQHAQPADDAKTGMPHL